MAGFERRKRISRGRGDDILSAAAERAVLDDMERTPFLSKEKTGTYLVLRYLGMDEEYGMALFFSKSGMLLGESPLQIGQYLFSNEFCDVILAEGARLGASSFILAHNHVHSRPVPSAADLATTDAIEKFFADRELVYADHFIVAGSDYTTLKTDGYWSKRYDGKKFEL